MYGYEIYIKTKYNEIKIFVEDINDPQVQEILAQPWVEDTKIEKINREPDKNFKKLVKMWYF